MYFTPSKPVALDELPNEVLYIIIEYIGDERHLPRKFRATHALSLVNHHLRECVVPFLYRNLRFSKYSRLNLFKRMAGLSKNWGANYADHVQSICVGSDRTFFNLEGRASCKMRFPFPSLRSLEVIECLPERNIMHSLQDTRYLEHLTLAWRDTWPFPDISYTPSLQTLRLNIVYRPDHSIPTPFPSWDPCSVSLTTLHLNNVLPGDWPAHYWLELTFLQLRVLHVQHTSTAFQPVFDFVHRHPTLMEVNLDFESFKDIRLEAILKLIDGTGSWCTPSGCGTFVEGNRRFYLTPEKTMVYLDESEVDLTDFQSYPDDIPDTHYVTTEFAFKRVPLTPEAIKWKQQAGSPIPRYQATEFFITLNDQDTLDAAGVAFGSLHEFFLLADRFPAVEILRVTSEELVLHEPKFSEYMRMIGTNLQRWTKLREFALCFYPISECYEWGWNEHPIPPPRGEGALWHYAVPPTERWLTATYMRSDLKRIYEDTTVGDAEKLEVIDRACVNTDPEELTPNDLTFFMRLWQERNEVQLAKLMRRIAEGCPSLERFDWYPVAGDNEQTTLWSWKFLREDRNDKRPVKLVSGNLSWVGCTRGDPEPLMALVGQEREYHRSVTTQRSY